MSFRYDLMKLTEKGYNTDTTSVSSPPEYNEVTDRKMVLPLELLPKEKQNLLPRIPATMKHPTILAALFGILLLVFLPYFHLGVPYTFWNTNKPPIDKKLCSCSCWDTLFKGSNEVGGRSGYKHIYFNITPQTFKIWALSAVVYVVFYESVKHLSTVVLAGQVRLSMLVLVCTDLYPHYYGWWMYFNAWNDDFYKQWYHQAFFSLTELASSAVVFYLCDRKHEVRPRLSLIVISVAVLHILASGGDQFISNVVYQKGAWHQLTRDLGFMIPDLMHIVFPAYELLLLSRQKRLGLHQLFTPLDLFLSAASILLLWAFVAHL